MRRPIIVGNWKMNKTIAETKEFVANIDSYVKGEADFGIATPFTALSEATKAQNLIVAAQNCHFEESGAFTGEVSIPMLQELGIKWCIIGHSERRQMFGDSDETVNLKLKALLKHGLKAIVCIGETESEFDAGETEAVLRKQLQGSLAGISAAEASEIVIAYEPIWAIGTGKQADVEIAQKCCHLVREVVKEMFGAEASAKVRIQYGGSVKPDNIKGYLAQEDIDGALIGGASLKVASFKELIDAVK